MDAGCVNAAVKVENLVTQPILIQNTDNTTTFPAVHFELVRLECAFLREDVAGIGCKRAHKGYIETNSAAMGLLLLCEVTDISGQREKRQTCGFTIRKTKEPRRVCSHKSFFSIPNMKASMR